GVVLALRTVGLADGLEPQRRTSHRRCQLPAHELATQVELVAEGQCDHRLSGPLQRAYGLLFRITVDAHVNEQPVRSVCLGTAERLALHGHDSLALPAGAPRP